MAEIFVNVEARTTLVAAISAGATSLEIIPGALSPSGPQFRLRIDQEYLLVTAVSGGSNQTYTVTRGIEGSTAAAHEAGAVVRYVVTKGALGGQSDPAAATPGLRTLGTGAQQAAPGNDARFTTGAFGHGSAAAPSIAFSSDPNTGFYRTAEGNVGLSSNGSTVFANNADTELRLKSTTALSWSSGDPATTAADVFLRRDSANTLALRADVGANPQAFNIYNTYTDGSNYEAFQVGWASNILTMQTVGVGTGVTRTLRIGLNAQQKWEFLTGTPNLVPESDNTQWLGDLTHRVAIGHFGARVGVGTLTNMEGYVYIGGITISPATFYMDTPGAYSQLSMRRSNGTPAARTDVANGDYIGLVGFNSWSGSIYHFGAQIAGAVDGTFTSGQAPPSRLEFATNAAGAGQVTCLILKSTGQSLFSTGSAAAPAIAFISEPTAGFYLHATGLPALAIGGSPRHLWSADVYHIAADTARLTMGVGADVSLFREAANTLAMRNGVGANPQSFYIYNTFTDTSNYERGGLIWNANRLILFTQKAGSGTARPLYFGVNGGANWFLDATTAALMPEADNSTDIGDITHRVRSGYFTGAGIRIGDMVLSGGGPGGIAVDGDNYLGIYTNGSLRWAANLSANDYSWHPGGDNTQDIGLIGTNRVRRLYLGQYMQLSEMADPSAPAADNVRVYSRDNGAGKTQLVAVFPTGAVQVLATEP